MDATGSRGRDTHSELARVLRIGACHEGGRFLVSHLDETNLVLPFPERLHDPIDPVTGQTEDDVNSPVVNRVDQDVRCCRRHRGALPVLRVQFKSFRSQYPAAEWLAPWNGVNAQ